MDDTAGTGASRRRPRSLESLSSERVDPETSRETRRRRSTPSREGPRREGFDTRGDDEQDTTFGLQSVAAISPPRREQRGEGSRPEASASTISSSEVSSSCLNEDTEDGGFVVTGEHRLRKGMHYLDDKWFFYGNPTSCLVPAIDFVPGDQGAEESGVCPSVGEVASGSMPETLVSLLRPTVIPDSDDEIGSDEDPSDAVDSALSNLVDDQERVRRYFRSRRHRPRCIRAVWRGPTDLCAIAFYGERGAALQERLDSIPVRLDSLSPISLFEMEDYKAQVTSLAREFHSER